MNSIEPEPRRNLYEAPASELLEQQSLQAPYSPSQFFSFDGRIGRLNYLISSILITFTLIAMMVISVFLPKSLYSIFGLATFLCAIWLSLALIVKRLHDLNQGGHLALPFFIPFLNILFVIWALFMPGTKGANSFGEQPETAFSTGLYDESKRPTRQRQNKKFTQEEPA